MTNFDTTDRDLAPSRDSRHSPELGLASLIMGAVLFLAAPITLILAVQVWAFSDHSPHTVQLHAWLAWACRLRFLRRGRVSCSVLKESAWPSATGSKLG